MDNIDLFFTIINEFFNNEEKEALPPKDEGEEVFPKTEEEIINSTWFKDLCKAAVQKQEESFEETKDEKPVLNEKNIEIILKQYAPKYFIEAFYRYKKEILQKHLKQGDVFNTYKQNTENINNNFLSEGTSIQNIYKNSLEQNKNYFKEIENNEEQMILNLPANVESRAENKSGGKAPLNINLTIQGTFNLQKTVDINDFGQTLAQALNQANENRDNIPI